MAALSGAAADGFTVSGCWRQQFDWVVIEWNRDNVFEHPALRNLPDGDLSGLQLSYEEVRTNCIPLDSTLYATVDWPYLRVWTQASGVDPYCVRLADYATAIGEYADATAEFELQGTPTAGDSIELAWLDQHCNVALYGSETLESAVNRLAAAITANQAAGAVSATASGTHIVLTWHGAPGSNGNRIGVYGTVHGSCTESWAPSAANFTGGVSPERWRVALDFSALVDKDGVALPPLTKVRKMRWTWAADLQSGNFARSEFAVAVTNWSVSGTNVQYSVAGTGSRRIEDDAAVAYEGPWTEARGNYSGGSIRWTDTPGARVSCTYSANGDHRLYLGTRLADHGGQVAVQVDGGTPLALSLAKSAEDVLVRVPIAALAGQAEHTVTITHTGAAGTLVYFDFLELAYPSGTLPDFDRMEQTTLATDWDTDHSLAIAPERTAWLIQKLGFHGRANHYAGAMWFYELHRVGHSYASGTITFSGTPEFASGKKTQVFLGSTPIEHVNLIGDTAESIATCFALLINAGSTGAWARADGAVLTITSRQMGLAGNAVAISVNTDSTAFTAARKRGHARGRGRRGLADGYRGAGEAQSGGARLESGVLSGIERLRHYGDGGVQHGIAARRRHTASEPGAALSERRPGLAEYTRATDQLRAPEHGILAGGLRRDGGLDGECRGTAVRAVR